MQPVITSRCRSACAIWSGVSGAEAADGLAGVEVEDAVAVVAAAVVVAAVDGGAVKTD